MDPQYIGKKVSLEIKALGFYQGTIDRVSMQDQSITIKGAFHNGKSCDRPSITFRYWKNLQSIMIIIII